MNHLGRLIAATALGLLVSGPASATLMEMTFTGVWEEQFGDPSVLPAQATSPADSYRATVRWNADTVLADAGNINGDIDYTLTTSPNLFDDIDLQLLFTPNIDGALVLDSDILFGISPGVQSVGISFLDGRVDGLEFIMGRQVGAAFERITFYATNAGQPTVWESFPTGNPNVSSTLSAELTITDGYAVTDPVAVAVPEPTSVALVGLALAAFGFSRRRRA